MTVREFTQQDEQEFEEYLDALGEVMNHERRLLPLTSYCTGLLLPLDSKTMEAMAATLAPQRTLALHHRLQNFITDAPWSDAAVLAVVRAQVLPAMLKQGPVRSWIIDDTGLPKKGRHSVGTARQYCGQLGKVDNCQVLVTLSVANAVAALPIDARLYLPQAWTQDAQRCQQAGVPLDITFATKPALALEQIRAAHAAGVPAGVVLGDEAFGANGPFRRGVRALGLDYALGVPGSLTVLPAADGRQARRWRGQAGPLSVRQLAGLLPRAAWRWITWRDGTGPELTGRFAKLPVRVAADAPDSAAEEQMLLIEWPTGARDPTGYWLLTRPAGIPLPELVGTAKDRWWVERGYRELKQEVGLRDFQGRGWRGFHHHVTLCLAAYGFLVLSRCRHPQAHQAASSAKNMPYPKLTAPNRPPIRPERHVPWSIRTLRKRLTLGLVARLPRCTCCHASQKLQV